MNKINYDSLIKLKADSDNINLRPIKTDDSDYIVRWRNNEIIRSQFIFRDNLTIEMHQEWLQNKVYCGLVIQYIIEVEHHPIGSVYVRDVDLRNESGEFGIFIGEADHIGKGIGTKTTQCFIKYCFELGFHRIFLRVFDTNVIAKKSYGKAGFKIEGTARDMVYIDGIRYDITFMSVLKKDFFY